MNNNDSNKYRFVSQLKKIEQSALTLSTVSLGSKEYSLINRQDPDREFSSYSNQQYIRVSSQNNVSFYYGDRVYAVSVKSLEENLLIIEQLKAKGYDAYLPFQETCHYIIYVSINTVSAMSDKIGVLESLNSNVAFADTVFNFDGLMEANAIPNDSWYNLQWYLPFVDMERAWDVTTGSSDVTVAVLDTGVGNSSDEYSQDIKPKLIPGASFIIGQPSTFDEYGHGTACAHVVGAATNNSFKMAGVVWNCNICPIKILDKTGSGPWSALAAGIFWAADNNCDVLSCSCSGGANTATDSGVASAIDYAISKNCIVVFAAGNSGPGGNNPPANYSPVISVGAVDKNKNVATFSSQQSGSLGGKSNNKMTVCAPGVDILTMGHVDDIVGADGTSFACPIVAGCCALLKSLDKSLNHNQVKNIIQLSTGPNYLDDYRGYGIINAKNVLINPPTPTPTCTATPTVTPTKTVTPSVTKTNTPTKSPTRTVTPTKTVTASVTPTITPTLTSRARYHEISIDGLPINNFSNNNILDLKCCTTAQPTPSPTVTPTNTPTKTTSPTPTNTQSATKTPTPTQTSTPANTSTPTQTITSSATSTPTVTPTNTVTQTATVSPTVTSTLTPTATVSPTATPSVTPTEGCVCATIWDPDNCINLTISRDSINSAFPVFVDDGKLPSGPKPLVLNLKISKTIYSNGILYTKDPNSNSLWRSGPGGVGGLSLSVFDGGFMQIVRDGVLWTIPLYVRYRSEYSDYTLSDFTHYVYSDYYFDIKYADTCRVPDASSDCGAPGACVNSPSIDYTALPSYNNYFSGCTGRPIDIDTDACNGTRRPATFSKSNFVLYYQGGANQPFLIIDNVAYDPRGTSGLIKVFTTSSPATMRDMVCNRLRFATLTDASKLSTNISEALTSNWPYNDLYWYSSCSNLPNEVPINLVPC